MVDLGGRKRKTPHLRDWPFSPFFFFSHDRRDMSKIETHYIYDVLGRTFLPLSNGEIYILPKGPQEAPRDIEICLPGPSGE